jgi:hypothetical protein
MRLKPEEVALELPHWWYVEWSPLGAVRAVKVEDAHYRNFQAFKDRVAVGYEPVGLFPTLETAMEHVRDLKRMKREQKHDGQATGFGDEDPDHESTQCARQYSDL